MNEYENEEGHILIMNTLPVDCTMGSDAITFEMDNQEYELKTLLEVVTFVNSYVEKA